MSSARPPAALVLAGALGLAVVVGVGTTWAATSEPRPSEPLGSPGEAPAEPESRPPPAVSEGTAAALPERIDTLFIGGGPSPDSNEVEIEASVELATEVLGAEHGVVLFAGGPATRSVQVRDAEVVADALLSELAELFAPRNGRDARYRPTTLARVHGAASPEEVERLLPLALFQPGPAPLTVVLIGHGSGGDAPVDASFLYWGGVPLDATVLSELLAAPGPPDTPRRRVRVIATSCYAGGLAEIAFEGADPSIGPVPDDVCGLFATAWDLEAAGCDANPERGESDGYAIHFFQALRGRDRDGAPLQDEIDLDSDGTITLLEAHTRARIASRSIDVPTTTSNRLLRTLAPDSGPSAPVDLPEELAVMDALGEALGDSTIGAIETRLSDVEAAQGEAKAGLEELEAAYDVAWTALTNELLSRWPVIDDPFHPDFARTLREEGADVQAFLEASPARAELSSLQDQVDALAAQSEGLELEISLLRRWLEADETIELASRLRARGGAGWDRYERMRACESSPP